MGKVGIIFGLRFERRLYAVGIKVTFMTFYEEKYILGALCDDGFDAILPRKRQ